MKRSMLILALGAVLLTAACSDEAVKVQKSPCVGADNSPCGPKRDVNGKPLTMGAADILARILA